MKPRHYLVELTSCLGKVAFDTFAQAKAIVERTRRGPADAKHGVYRCPACEKWHVGRHSPTSKAKRSIMKKRMELETAMLDESE